MDKDTKDYAMAQMRKGILELCVLAVLNRGDAYSTDIIETLKQSEVIVVEGTLYPILTRMKNQGYLSYRWEESKTGPPRKYYSITESGRVYFRILKKSWEEFSHSIHSILKQ